jgi:hypothetical protein
MAKEKKEMQMWQVGGAVVLMIPVLVYFSVCNARYKADQAQHESDCISLGAHATHNAFGEATGCSSNPGVP